MTRKTRQRPASTSVTITHLGKEYRGSYYVEHGCVTVQYDLAEKSTQLGGHAHYPEQLAMLLLSEMVRGLP